MSHTAGTVNKMTDDWMQERTKAPLDKMKDWVKHCAYELGTPLVEAVNDRIGIAQAGKHMLDEGGEDAELGILAKKIALDAVALDEEIIDRIHDAAILYGEAASLLQTQTSGLGPLGHLVEAYGRRSSMYNQMSQGLDEAPQEPPMSDVEWDAVRFVKLRQFKAQLGLRDKVGGRRAGRHGYSFFNCIERDDRSQRVPAHPQITNAAREEGWPEEKPAPTSESLTPSIVDWSVSAGGHHAGDSTDCGKRPGGTSMASLIEPVGKREQTFEPPTAMQNSQSLKRGDTLDTLETCLDSLDNMKMVIETLDAQPSATQSGIHPQAQIHESTHAGGAGMRSSSPSGYLTKDAERQAASRRVLQEARQQAPLEAPESTQGSFAMASATEEALVPTGSFLAPGCSASSSMPPLVPNMSLQASLVAHGEAVSQGSFAVADAAHAASRDVPNVASQRSSSSHMYSGPAGAHSQASNPSSTKQWKPYGNYEVQDSIASSQKDNRSSTPRGRVQREAPYPAPDASLASYAVGAPTQSLQLNARSSTPTPVGVCPYRVNDPVEIKSKSANSWIPGKVVRVDGWVLTVRYGDRERKVDLNGDHVSQFFRSVQQYAAASPAPAFDSMLTNMGGPKFTDVDSVISIGARHTKAAVL
jgi:hypothetical protein